MTNEELDLVPTETLIEAVCRRFDAIVLAHFTEKDTSRSSHGVFSSGNPILVAGLSVLVSEIGRHRAMGDHPDMEDAEGDNDPL